MTELSSGHSLRASRIYFIGCFAIVSYITYGKYSLLFEALWHYWPGFSGLRVWGRFNIILIPLFGWALACSLEYFEKLFITNPALRENSNRSPAIKSVLFFGGFYAAILLTQLYLFSNNIRDSLWLRFFETSMKSSEIFFIYTGAAAFISLTALILFGRYGSHYPKAKLTLFVVLTSLVPAVEFWPVGAHSWIYPLKYPGFYIPCEISNYYPNSFLYKRIFRHDTLQLVPVFNTGVIDIWYFNRYTEFLKNSETQISERQILLGVATGQKVFATSSISYTAIADFLADSRQFSRPGKLVSYTGDELVWQTDMPIKGYLSFIDNWDPNWKAYVDNKAVPIERLFGTFKSVPLTQGQHRVIFRYEPTLKTIILGTM